MNAEHSGVYAIDVGRRADRRMSVIRKHGARWSVVARCTALCLPSDTKLSEKEWYRRINAIDQAIRQIIGKAKHDRMMQESENAP